MDWKPGKNSNVVSRLQGDKVVFQDGHSIYVLGEEEAVVWNLCDGEHTVAEIAQEMKKKVPAVKEERVEQEVESFIQKLKEKELIL